MPKKCIVCGEEARYAIKDTSDYYCEDCAHENFADVAMLLRVEEIATNLKKKLESIQLDDDGQVIAAETSDKPEQE